MLHFSLMAALTFGLRCHCHCCLLDQCLNTSECVPRQVWTCGSFRKILPYHNPLTNLHSIAKVKKKKKSGIARKAYFRRKMERPKIERNGVAIPNFFFFFVIAAAIANVHAFFLNETGQSYLLTLSCWRGFKDRQPPTYDKTKKWL